MEPWGCRGDARGEERGMRRVPCPSTLYHLASSPPHPTDVPTSASHVSLRYLKSIHLSGTMPTEMGSLASMNTL